MLAMDIGHEVLGRLWQVQNCLEADNLRSRRLNGRILFAQQAQVVQLLGCESTFGIHS